MAKVELRNIIKSVMNIPEALREAQVLTGAMRRNSRRAPSENPVTQKVTPRRQMPPWAVAMRIAAEDKNPPRVQISEARKTDEVPEAIKGIIKRRNNSRKATEGLVAYARRGVQKRTEDALMSHELDLMFKHGVQTDDNEVFK